MTTLPLRQTTNRSLTALLLTGTLLGGMSVGLATPAQAAPRMHTIAAAHKLIHPGAFCAGYDHGKKAKAANGHTYRCVHDGARWRWKRA